MSEYEHDKIVPYAASHAAKKEQVATMFDHIAKRYDFLNRFLSLGIDQGWRKKAIGYFGQQKINHLLDIATGTADMALMADKTIAPHKITGIDISEGMMQYGRIKIADKGLSDRIQLITGDSTAIPFEDQTFEIKHNQQINQFRQGVKRRPIPLRSQLLPLLESEDLQSFLG